MKTHKIVRKLIIISFIFLSAAIHSCSNKTEKGYIILTETPVSLSSGENSAIGPGNCLPGSRISKFIPGDPASLQVLTSGFFSACSPVISYDGHSILFSAQREKDEKWQIWEMNLDNNECRKVISSGDNCTDPVYLPDGRMVFSKETVNDTVVSAYCLYSCSSDGTDLRQITFSPSDNQYTKVLKDGRLLTVNTSLLPEKGTPLLMVLRPDGTKAELFYKSPSDFSPVGGLCETADGRLLFIESGTEPGRNKLVSITYNRPLHSRTELANETIADFHSVIQTGTGKYFVTCRKQASESFSLFEFDPADNSLTLLLEPDNGFSLSGVLSVEEQSLPKKLPSEVDLNVKTGLLLCQDINYLNPFLPDSLSRKTGAVKIEVLGIDTTYGIVNAEKDGSFQLKVMADKPFRIRTIDERGNPVNGPCSWIWLRPNERRGCIGCHEDPEMVPQNKVSLAIWKPPVLIPVHITKVSEKTVELE